MRGFVLLALGWAFASAHGLMFVLLHDTWYIRLCAAAGIALFGLGCATISGDANE